MYLLVICLGGLGLVYRVNFCWVADSFAISLVPTRNASLWSFEVLHSPPQGFSAYTHVPNSIECLISEDVRLKDREIFHYSINIFGNSKSDIAGKCGLDHVSESVPVDEKSSIVCIEDTSNPQVLLSRTPVIFLIMRPLAITNLKPQFICLALKSLAIIASDVDACETVVVRRFITFFLVATFLFLGLSSDILNIMDVSVSFSVVSHKLTWILISDGYLSKEAYRGCAVELMGPFVFPGFGR
ncbi:hypothetical protein V1477_017732 [Vespula maculifrons]|uniref:Uncharacterized protein n=1 Tax=Vespula maculifrons TaxID=7453 RepID=A0ABD2B0I9_VESMC